MIYFKCSFYSLWICLCVLLITLFSQAQNSKDSVKHTFSLQQAVDYAYQNQTKVLNALVDEKIAKSKVNEVTGLAYPQISGSFDVKYFYEIPTQLLPDFISPSVYGVLIQEGLIPAKQLSLDQLFPVQFGTKYNATAGIEASQILFDATVFTGLQAVKVYLELMKKATQRTKIETAVTVSKAYYTVLINEERTKTLDANIERVKKLLDDTKALYENGFVEKIDMDRISVTYSNLLVEKEKVQRFLNLSYNLLKYQMGMPLNISLTLTEKLENVNFQIIENQTESFDYGNRIEYSLYETQRKLLGFELQRNRAGYAPSLFAYGSLSTQAQRNEFNIFDFSQKWYPVGVVGVKLTIPIFDGLQKHYRIQQSKLSLLKLSNDIKFLEQSIDLELSNAKVTLQNTGSSLEAQKKNIELAEEINRVAKIKYEQGVGSNIEVINAETSLKEAQTNYYSALYDAIIAKIDYDKATGVIK